jgi:hypothetical protein
VTVALRYRGGIVQQWTCVIVDGDRYCVHVPDAVDDGFVFPKKELPLARLLFALHQNRVTAVHLGTFLKQAGIRVA